MFKNNIDTFAKTILMLLLFGVPSAFSSINPGDPGLADSNSFGGKCIKKNGATARCV
jgi:hypothetical protein